MAEPQYIEIWFLSEKKTASLPHNFQIIDINQSRSIAQAPEGTECIPYGEGCFHPQYGYYEKGSGKVKASHDDHSENKPQKAIENKQLSNIDVDLINCDKNYYFDMFCGKAKPNTKSKPAKLEVWVDTSASFRPIDDNNNGECHRRSLVRRLQTRCSGALKVATFDTAKQVTMDYSNVCNSRGSNNTDRLIQWIEASRAKKLIVITDISEYNQKLGDYLDEVGAKIKGEVPRKELIASDLVGEVNRLQKYCL